MTKYDVLVLGAGPAGLMAATVAARSGCRVLLAEAGEAPGGCWGSLHKGRFGFEARPVELFGGKQAQKIRALLEENGVQASWQPAPERLGLVTRDGGPELTLTQGKEAFLSAMAESCRGCRESLEDFWELASQTEQALAYLADHPRASAFTLMSRYAGFVRCAGHTVDEVLTALALPERAAAVLKSGFHIHGCDCGKLNFADFAVDFLERMEEPGLRPAGGGRALMLALEKAYTQAGGELWYHCPVERLLTREGRVTGALLTNGRELAADTVVADAAPSLVYGRWLAGEVPQKALAAEAAQGPGAQGFAVLLGLEKSMEALGLRQEKLVIRDFADSAKEAEARKSLENTGPCLAVCRPVAEGKGCTLALYGLYAGNAWQDISEEQYEAAKNAVADKMLTCFEQAAHTRVRPAITEAVLLGPAEYAALGGGAEGQVLWHTPHSWQTPFARETEAELSLLPGLRLCGSGSGSRTLARALTEGAAAGKAVCSGKEARR